MNRRRAVEPILAKARVTPFSWESQFDCGLGLGAPVALALTGKDIGAPFRGQYTTALGAQKALLKAGFKNLDELVAAHFTRVQIAIAQYGDIAVLDGDETGIGLGIVLGERIAVLTPSGYGTIERCKAKWAYRIA